ncbi:hypothetical protein PAXRUDRAFT_822188 [Paxillus rubicundulus Ve08.2h10]|uniref:Uncharacterized protein n=1 Tax=Paxillus rubicundulus Ve08.2h10 TaxID=930991 RepID=A0A0D0DMH7_9AGAM|nr:hypothetical protein PAXRUDRAFT_822188 [Paxillus rubicundulus Ve08.2h10]
MTSSCGRIQTAFEVSPSGSIARSSGFQISRRANQFGGMFSHHGGAKRVMRRRP